VILSLEAILQKAPLYGIKSKGSSNTQAMAANILQRVLRPSNDWPIAAAKVAFCAVPLLLSSQALLTDSLGNRLWVDLPETADFCKDVLTIIKPSSSAREPHLSTVGAKTSEVLTSPMSPGGFGVADWCSFF
jgi:hypothetical protein